MKEFKDINQSTSAKRKIKLLAKNSNLDVEFVTLLANVSWDYDIDPNWREPFGWVQDEQLKSIEGQETFTKIAKLLAINFPRTNTYMIDSILKRYIDFDKKILFQNFLLSGKTKNNAYLSEYSTYHYLNNLTKENLSLLDFKKEYSIEVVANMLFRKIFNGGSVNRNGLIYCYCDLCLKLPYLNLDTSKNKVLDWSKQVVTQINNLPEKSTLSDLINCTKSEIKGNKYFKQQILQGLTYSGILKVKNIKIEKIFIPKFSNELSSHFYSNEWTFPLRFWNDTKTIIPIVNKNTL